MLEPEEVERWQRLARALAAHADDAEGLAQVLQIVELFDSHAMAALDRLTTENVYSYAYLASGLSQSRQALQQRHARYLARPRSVEPPAVVPIRGSAGRWRWRCRCAAWQHCVDERTARDTAAAHAAECVIRTRTATAHVGSTAVAS